MYRSFPEAVPKQPMATSFSQSYPQQARGCRRQTVSPALPQPLLGIPKATLGGKMNSYTKFACQTQSWSFWVEKKSRLRMMVFVDKTASLQFLQLHLLPMVDAAKNPIRSSSIHTQELLLLLMCIIWTKKSSKPSSIPESVSCRIHCRKHRKKESSLMQKLDLFYPCM